MRQPALLAIFGGLVILAGLLLYLPGLSGPLIFDDKPALSSNEAAQISGSSFEEWRVAALSSDSGPLKRPIAMLSFATNHALAGGFSRFQLKFVNLVIHTIIAVVLYFLSYSILSSLAIGRDSDIRRLIAITAAAIWLLHPLQVSTVLYVVQRMAQLAAMFVVLGLFLFVRWRQRWAERGASTGELLAAALWLLLLTLLAVLSKENGALLPWLVIVVEVCVFRGAWGGKRNRYLQYGGWFLCFMPVLFVLMVFFINPDNLTGRYSWREFTLDQRLLTQGRLLWRYLGWILFPDINGMGFHHDDIPLSRGLLEPVSTILALAAWLLALALAFFLRQRCPLLLLAVLFYLVGHSLESSVIPLEMVYEHRNYLPSMMVCLAVAALLVISATSQLRVGVRYPVLGVLAILSTLLFTRVQIWADELSLFRAGVANHPESSRSNYSYANALLRRYRQREELQLSEQESNDLLLLSRHYFERMYQANNRDVAAIVMLYYLDSRYFRQLQAMTDWFAELETLLETRTLQASDWNALDTLFDCFASGPCEASQARVIGLLDTLTERYPLEANVLRYRYRYLKAIEADQSELLSLLQKAQAIAPGQSWIYYYLLYELARVQDAARMYDYAQLWLLNDPKRAHLLRIKALFTESNDGSGSSHD